MLQVVLTGLSTGAIYGLVAMGFAIVFYVTRVINFATGQLFMAAIMITAGLSRGHWPASPPSSWGCRSRPEEGSLSTSWPFVPFPLQPP